MFGLISWCSQTFSLTLYFLQTKCLITFGYEFWGQENLTGDALNFMLPHSTYGESVAFLRAPTQGWHGGSLSVATQPQTLQAP